MRVLTAVALGALALTVTLAIAATGALAPADLKDAIDRAVAKSRDAGALDSGYELIALAGVARAEGHGDLERAAVEGLGAVVTTTARGLAARGIDAVPDIGRLVDLRFAAATNQVDSAGPAIDSALRSALPAVAAEVRRDLDRQRLWSDRLADLGLMADVQAAAVQCLLDDSAGVVATAFDDAARALDADIGREANAELRSQRAADLSAARQARDERVADAASNTVATLVAQMRQGRAGASAGDGAPISGPPLGPAACTEIWLPADMPPPRRAIAGWEGECIDSGRSVLAAPCPRANAAFGCAQALYFADPAAVEAVGASAMTLIYRATFEEADAASQCPAAARVAVVDPPDDLRRVLTCGPTAAQ